MFSPLLKREKAPDQNRTHRILGRELPLRISENPRARRLTLRIDPAGGLRVTVPPGIPDREIEGFLDRHQDWLKKRVAGVPDQPEVRAGIKVPVMGKPHLVVHDPEKRGAAFTRSGPNGPEIVVGGEARFIKRKIGAFLKSRAKAEIEPLVAKHSAAIGKKVKKITYRDTSSRWGSCSSDGKLSFCWRIAMAPKPIIDYLVAHEVAHLREMNHGPQFWEVCQELCPRTDEAKAWLKKNGRALQAIGF